jgi:hypothetical protein
MALVLIAFCGAAAAPARSEEAPKIQDNSFLIEEAYNQEPGVIQHIQTLQLMRGGTVAYSFTEEWPALDKTHQVSATVPIARLAETGPSGVGDLLLNYRWQALDRGALALAPRFSLLLPTGSYHRGLGSGSWGLQTNLPLSLEISPRFVTHWNAGGTWMPSARSASRESASLGGLSGGASVIWAATTRANAMLELLAANNQVLEADGSIARQDLLLLNPGVRFALDFPSGLQIVPGLSAPIGIGPSRGERGVLFYLSFEHSAFAPAAEDGAQ